MSEPLFVAPLWDSKRRVILLRTLMYMNAQQDYPTATELVRESDPRHKIPRATLHARRSMIKDMRSAGLIAVKDVPTSRFTHLAITEEGIAFVQRAGKEA